MNCKDYRDYNDFELLSYAAENIEEANEIIFKKYEPLISIIANKVYPLCINTGVELNDLIQEGIVGLNLAIDSFDSNRDTVFYTYARICIERSIIRYVYRNRGFNNKSLNMAMAVKKSDDELYSLFKNILDNSLNPERILLDKEISNEIEKKLRKMLTEFELKVFELRLADFSYREIAVMLNKKLKCIDNAVQRIRIKAQKLLNA